MDCRLKKKTAIERSISEFPPKEKKAHNGVYHGAGPVAQKAKSWKWNGDPRKKE